MTTPSAADPVRVRLAQISERARLATEGPWWVTEEQASEAAYIPPSVMALGTADYWSGDSDEYPLNQHLAPADAEFVAHSRADVPALLAAVNAVLDLTAKARHGATRWADPLPVPEWVDRVELAVAAALEVTE